MDYQQYLQDCERIRADNETLLADFEEWLLGQDLSSKTVRNHVFRMRFYINEFLLYEDAVEARHGVSRVGMFLGYWFINKAPSSKTGIKDYTVSLKKFYEFMGERGQISEEALSRLNDTVKARLPEWLEAMDRYEARRVSESDDLWDALLAEIINDEGP
jgi:intergrase/recombinase